MSMIAKDSGNISIEKLENGVYTAISSMIIDLGLQVSEKFDKTQRKMMILWNVLGEEVEINGEKQPRVMSKEYSFSLGEKSNLRKDLQAWRGKSFTDDELHGFNILNILNKPCQLQIILEEKNGKKYNNIASIMALPKGTTVDAIETANHFDIEEIATWKYWSEIPTWIQDKIKKAQNFQSSGLDKFVKEYEETIKKDTKTESTEPTAPMDDLPF